VPNKRAYARFIGTGFRFRLFARRSSHQAGWTGLVAKLPQPRNMSAKKTAAPKPVKAAANSRAQETVLVKA